MKIFNNKLFLVCLISFSIGIFFGLGIKFLGSNEIKFYLLNYSSLLFQITLRLFQLLFTLYLFSSVTILFYNAAKMKDIHRKSIMYISFAFLSCLILFAIVFLDIEHLFNPDFILFKNIGKIDLLFIVESFIPKSLFDALSHNNGLQVFVFSIFFGLAAYAVKADKIIEQMSILNKIIIKTASMLFWLFPLALFLFASLFMIKYM